MTIPIWVVLTICIAAANGKLPVCEDQVYADPVESFLVCQLVAGDISRIYEGSYYPRCIYGPKPDLPDINFAASDRWG